MSFRNAFTSSVFEASKLSGKKKSTEIKFLGAETSGWGGGLPREGVGVEKLVPSLESLFFLDFQGENLGCPENFGGTSRTTGGVQKACAKKLVLVCRPLNWSRVAPYYSSTITTVKGFVQLKGGRFLL